METKSLGLKYAKALQPGDIVYLHHGNQGKKCKVISVTPITTKAFPCVEITATWGASKFKIIEIEKHADTIMVGA